jgi:hypothetical protein
VNLQYLEQTAFETLTDIAETVTSILEVLRLAASNPNPIVKVLAEAMLRSTHFLFASNVLRTRC